MGSCFRKDRIAMAKTEECLILALSAFLQQNKACPDPADTDIRELIGLCREQHVLPMVYDAVYDCRSVRNSPEAGKFRSLALAETVSQTERSAQFAKIYTHLTKKGLRPLAVKGVLCRSVFPKGHLRTSSDEDILVSEEEFSVVVSALTEYGMKMSEESGGEVCFTLDDCRIEVHKSLFDPSSAALSRMNAPFSDVHEAPVSYETENGLTVWSMKPEKHLLYLILHAYKHFIHSGFGIRQVCDVYLWAQRFAGTTDWDGVFDTLESLNAAVFAKAVFSIGERLAGEKLPLSEKWNAVTADPAPMLRDIMCSGVYGTRDLTRTHTATVTLNAVENESSAAGKSFLSSVFPSREKLTSQYPVLSEKPCLLPAVWLKRLWGYGREAVCRRGSDGSNGSDPAKTLKTAKDRLKLLKYYGIIK